MSNFENSGSASSTDKEQSISEYIKLRGAEEVRQTTCDEICTLIDFILEKMGSEIGKKKTKSATAEVNAPNLLADNEDRNNIDIPVSVLQSAPDTYDIHYHLSGASSNGLHLLFFHDTKYRAYLSWRAVFEGYFFQLTERQAQAALRDLQEIYDSRRLPGIPKQKLEVMREIQEKHQAAVRISMAAARERGVRLGRPTEHSPEVRRIVVDMRRQSFSLRNIADRLTAEGYATPRGGKRWYGSTVRSILQSERLDREAQAAKARHTLPSQYKA